jgi:hypothetical protein
MLFDLVSIRTEKVELMAEESIGWVQGWWDKKAAGILSF